MVPRCSTSWVFGIVKLGSRMLAWEISTATRIAGTFGRVPSRASARDVRSTLPGIPQLSGLISHAQECKELVGCNWGLWRHTTTWPAFAKPAETSPWKPSKGISCRGLPGKKGTVNCHSYHHEVKLIFWWCGVGKGTPCGKELFMLPSGRSAADAMWRSDLTADLWRKSWLLCRASMTWNPSMPKVLPCHCMCAGNHYLRSVDFHPGFHCCWRHPGQLKFLSESLKFLALSAEESLSSLVSLSSSKRNVKSFCGSVLNSLL